MHCFIVRIFCPIARTKCSRYMADISGPRLFLFLHFSHFLLLSVPLSPLPLCLSLQCFSLRQLSADYRLRSQVCFGFCCFFIIVLIVIYKIFVQWVLSHGFLIEFSVLLFFFSNGGFSLMKLGFHVSSPISPLCCWVAFITMSICYFEFFLQFELRL